MKKLYSQIIILAALSPLTLACGALGHSSSTGANDTPTNSDESNAEATYSTAVSFLGDSNSSSSDANTSVAALTTTANLSTGGATNVRQRYRCSDSSDASETFSCSNTTGVLSREVTFEDCEVTNGERTATLNGSFVNSVTNGGDGFCNSDQTFDFGNMVMGRDGEDAVHNHSTEGDGLVYSFTNARGKAVTLTETADTTRTFSDAVDANNDGIAESASFSVERNNRFIHEISGNTAHDLNAFTTDTDFTSTDEDGVETVVEVALPVHALTFDDEGEISTHAITSGDLIIDHNVAKIRTVLSVGDDGLSFDSAGTCSPQDGTATTTSYTINDDGTIGAQIGTGTIVFAFGEVESATYDGERLDVRPLPCK